MLQKFRDHTQGWIAWFLIILICFTFALWGIGNYLHTHNDKAVVATVNKHEISQHALDQAYEYVRQQRATELGHSVTQTEASEAAMRETALNQLITTTALIEDALHGGLRVAPASVKAAIENMPYFQQGGQFNEERFREVLRALGITIKQLSDDIRQQLLLEQMYSALTVTSFALPIEAKQQLSLQRQKRIGGYGIVPESSVKSPQPPTDEALQAYYHGHQAEYQVPEKIQLAYVELSAQDFLNDVTITPQQIAAYYEENQERYHVDGRLLPLSQVEKTIRGELKNRRVEQAFAEAIDDLSNVAYEDPTSLKKVAQTMHLPIKTTATFTRDTLPNAGLLRWPQVRNIIFSDAMLAGNNSDVIVLEPGVSAVVVRVAQHEPAHTQPFSAVKPQIAAALLKERKAQLCLEKARTLAQAINSHKQPPQRLLKQEKLTWQPLNTTRNNKTVPSPIVHTLFAMPALGDSTSSTQHAEAVALAHGDAAVVVLQRVVDVPPKALTPSAIETEQGKLSKAYGAMEYGLYKAGVIANAQVIRQ